MNERVQKTQDFGDYLVARGSLNPPSLVKLLSAVESTTHPLDVIMTELGLVGEDDLPGLFADYLGVQQIEALADAVSMDMVEAIGIDYLASAAAVPVDTSDGSTGLVVADPVLSDAVTMIPFLLDKPITLYSATRRQIAETLSALQNTDDEPIDETATVADGLAADDVDRLKEIANEAPIVRLLTGIVQRAVDMGASDIHIEPFEDSVDIRVRCDGVLVPVDRTDKQLLAGISTRLKILSRLNIAERRLPQDGRLRMAVRGRQIDMRVSILPSIHGETFVLRILDRRTVPLRLDALGYSDADTNVLRKLAGLGNGIILVTGPTGSGKTTTLYAMLGEIDTQRMKVFTVEDPVEYRIGGITQIQINSAIGLGFAETLRTVLRQDPDVILIGEIRDHDTAEIAVRAALTGHLVLATLHTNSAAGAFARLIDMSVEPYLLGDTVRAVIGQRLLRTVCKSCIAEDEHACKDCNGTGYRGRIATYEILEITPRLIAQARYWERESDIVANAAKNGFRTLAQHADKLVSAGVTDRREVARVLNAGSSPA